MNKTYESVTHNFLQHFKNVGSIIPPAVIGRSEYVGFLQTAKILSVEQENILYSFYSKYGMHREFRRLCLA